MLSNGLDDNILILFSIIIWLDGNKDFIIWLDDNNCFLSSGWIMTWMTSSG
jgi:hypothetical protein